MSRLELLDLDLLGNCEHIVDINPEIPGRALDFGVPKRSWTARRLPVLRYIMEIFVRRIE